MLLGEIQDFFECGDLLRGEFASEPGACIEAAQLREGKIVNTAFAVRGAVHRIVMNGHEARIAGELQVRLDKICSEGNGAAEGRQRIFWRVAGCPTMCDDQHSS